MDEADVRRLRVMLSVVLLSIAVGGTIDLVLDAPDRWLSGHVLYELALIIGGLVTTIALWLRWTRTERSLVQTQRSLAERQAERDAWRTSAERALQGLGA